jgi:RNA polymerase sigma-70 factor (ECF subfamily)
LSVQSSSSHDAGTNAPVDEDGRLIELARAGDGTAFDTLVQKHAERLLRMVRTLTPSREDAEDVTQETFAAAYFKLDSFAGRSSFFTWLYRIALNKAISKRRLRRLETTHQGRQLEDAPAAATDQPRAVDQLERDEELDRLRDAIRQLESDRQKVLVLRDVDGRDYGEIAEILNIPVGTVRSRLHRARCDLKQILVAQLRGKQGDDAL